MSEFTNKPGTDAAVTAAKKLEKGGFKDWEVVVADEYVLQIDHDVETEHAQFPPDFMKNLDLLQERCKSKSLRYEVSKSKSYKNNHIVIRMPIAMEATERVAWQLIFGSDTKREALNLISIENKVKNPILLFMQKDRFLMPDMLPPEKSSMSGPVGRRFRDIDD